MDAERIICARCLCELTLMGTSKGLDRSAAMPTMADALGWEQRGKGWICGNCLPSNPTGFNPDYVSNTPRFDRLGRPLRTIEQAKASRQ
jgi:hypothetical protein